jgi:hypothetical protein
MTSGLARLRLWPSASAAPFAPHKADLKEGRNLIGWLLHTSLSNLSTRYELRRGISW